MDDRGTLGRGSIAPRRDSVRHDSSVCLGRLLAGERAQLCATLTEQCEWLLHAHVVDCDPHYKYGVRHHLEGLPPLCVLPGNPNTLFLLGFSHEGMAQRQNAATHYTKFLKQVTSGNQADHAKKRLIEWGYLKPQA